MCVEEQCFILVVMKIVLLVKKISLNFNELIVLFVIVYLCEYILVVKIKFVNFNMMSLYL